MPHPVEEPRPAQPDLEPARVRTLLVILITAAFVVILNETVLSVALPDLMEELDIPAPTAQWLTTGFMLTMAVVIPTTGFVLQRFAHRRVFLAPWSCSPWAPCWPCWPPDSPCSWSGA